MRVAAVMSDLMLFSRIDAAASAAGASLVRIDSPHDLPGADEVDLVLIDWSARDADWADVLASWRNGSGVRLIAFGRHTDLEAHAAARAAGIGPMWARSKLLAALSEVLHT
jgi:DNA-binding response OmpR family regulator